MNFSKTQTFQLETFTPAQKAMAIKVAKVVGVGVAIAVAVDVISSFSNGNKDFEFSKIISQLIFPIIIFAGIFGKKGSLNQNTKLELSGNWIVYKENNRAKWKAPVAALTQIIQTQSQSSQKTETLFVTPDTNYMLPHTITKNREFLSAVEMLNPIIKIQALHPETAPMAGNSLGLPPDLTVDSGNMENYLRGAILAGLILIVIVYFLLK
ncbi:MAG: hypothetical protein COT92_00770 [Candidatus Doudnabacteria bacterium CG10_big_fil_rev_8_21_14_0_10_42_18]|uniref:Uncharacterized protein n=1 Tax=Candidatus Doudnabacteria bacterium CG10_big_fil_rev_8_21_14_0_10_42_18 TaxID=1974552 RepID=A0A2H0VBM5_9BACT|nr:MAG: hypothetical protein COT92_00770 [Candidatus Doudnabacteria bacterium CG10_big_fil_rev_8_21_14_0_10_42_18]